MVRNILSPRLLIGVLFLLLMSFLFFRSYYTIDAQTSMDTAIADAEKLIIEGEYYQAILALEPLLVSDQKSKAQEEALWLAHQLGETFVKKIEKEETEFDRRRSESETWAEEERIREVKSSWWNTTLEKMRVLDRLGADSGYWTDPISSFYYNEGFLQRLMDRYPESPRRGVAEYYLIFDWLGVPRPENLSLTLSALHTYIEKYEKTGRAEVYKAYLDIAHIHHGLWAVMTFEGCDGGMAAGLNPEDNTKSAEAHKAEAEKYYLKYYLNPHGLPEDHGYELLKNRKKFGWSYIIYGIC